MGGLPLPKIQRCCFCTRKLKWACIFIVCWSMLAVTHSMRILFCPICPKIYTRDGGGHYEVLTIIMWIMFFINILTLWSSFFFLLGIFMHMYRVSADIFMGLGILSAVLMFLHGGFNFAQIIGSECNNPSDIFAHFTYASLWLYFIFIVNSYRDDMLGDK